MIKSDKIESKCHLTAPGQHLVPPVTETKKYPKPHVRLLRVGLTPNISLLKKTHLLSAPPSNAEQTEPRSAILQVQNFSH